MIVSFGSKATADLYHGESSKEARKIPQDVVKTALKKLDLINAATTLQDLLVPPSNRLEALKGNLKGKYSIRINDQYRIVFAFRDGNVFDIEITDYH